jgi:hypothetical protein
MAIVEGPGGTPADLAATVWDLADGFALLAVTAGNKDTKDDLVSVANRLRYRAIAMEKTGLADRLQRAIEALERRRT